MKVVKHKFGVDKALMERQTYSIQLETANTSFEKHYQVMTELMSWAVERYDTSKEVFMLDWEILLK